MSLAYTTRNPISIIWQCSLSWRREIFSLLRWHSLLSHFHIHHEPNASKAIKSFSTKFKFHFCGVNDSFRTADYLLIGINKMWNSQGADKAITTGMSILGRSSVKKRSFLLFVTSTKRPQKFTLFIEFRMFASTPCQCHSVNGFVNSNLGLVLWHEHFYCCLQQRLRSRTRQERPVRVGFRESVALRVSEK